MVNSQISNLLRRLRLFYVSDWIRFYIERFGNRKINKEFKKNNREVALPPDYLIYESFQINYKKYYTESSNTAKWLVDFFRKYVELKGKKILDWGCGPGRIIRHLPNVIGNECEYFGTDYNKKSIDWCSKNLPGINFNNNTLIPILPYPDDYFDVIYGISIFTHLSEIMHYGWYNELFRVLKPNGIMLFTTHGENFKVKLTDSELFRYNKGELIVRGNVKEGHRTFGAYQPPEFMTKLFKNVIILDHIVNKPEVGRWLPQDIWIVRKTNNSIGL